MLLHTHRQALWSGFGMKSTPNLVQPVAPISWLLMNPAGQRRQAVAPAAEKRPALQGMQAVLMLPGE